MSKERLEKIETKYSTLTVSSEKNGTEYTEVDVEDLVFLIQNGFKQAERVEELEDKCNYLSDMNEMLVDLNGVLPDEPELYIKLKKENKRYREVINNINEKAMLYGVDEGVYEAIKEAIRVLEGRE